MRGENVFQLLLMARLTLLDLTCWSTTYNTVAPYIHKRRSILSKNISNVRFLWIFSWNSAGSSLHGIVTFEAL